MKIKLRILGDMVFGMALGTGTFFTSIAQPTFSDANWISTGGIPGANRLVNAAVVDESGNLHIAGNFGIVGDVFASHIAKRNGNSWSASGPGIGDEFSYVHALAVSGSDLSAGGEFTTAVDLINSGRADAPP